METREKIAEVCDLLHSLLGPKASPRVVRAYDLASSALGDFFSDANDTATLAEGLDDCTPLPFWFDDVEQLYELGAEPPF